MQCQCTKREARTSAKTLPVSLLSVLSKVLEAIITSKGRSVADLHLLLATQLSAALDQGKTTAIVALDIEGVCDQITKNRPAGIDGTLLSLLGDYLSNRHLRVTVSSRESELQPITADPMQDVASPETTY
ncbi:hypothetical protein E2C01_040174 [Portunus trituberculatus]|uniref:Uncharacterized protein n=1 Tax=Portunus trituberculatus TaxID=210409 RepID=A0A5B7FQ09_PORTR|nr:hypothetical protein [Portunus trituberculatus]